MKEDNITVAFQLWWNYLFSIVYLFSFAVSFFFRFLFNVIYFYFIFHFFSWFMVFFSRAGSTSVELLVYWSLYLARSFVRILIPFRCFPCPVNWPAGSHVDHQPFAQPARLGATGRELGACPASHRHVRRNQSILQWGLRLQRIQHPLLRRLRACPRMVDGLGCSGKVSHIQITLHAIMLSYFRSS